MQKFYACLAIAIATVIAQPQSAFTKEKSKQKPMQYLQVRMKLVTVSSRDSNSPRGTKPLPPSGLVNSPAASSSVGASRTNPTHR